MTRNTDNKTTAREFGPPTQQKPPRGDRGPGLRSRFAPWRSVRAIASTMAMATTWMGHPTSRSKPSHQGTRSSERSPITTEKPTAHRFTGILAAAARRAASMSSLPVTGLAAALLLLVAVSVVLIEPAIAQTPARVLVSNIGQEDDETSIGLEGLDQAQAFTTGGNTDGYRITSIDVNIKEVSTAGGTLSLDLSIWTSTSSGLPDTLVTTLTDPATLECQGRRQNMPVGRSKSVPPERSLASVNVRASCSGEVSQRQAGSRLGG